VDFEHRAIDFTVPAAAEKTRVLGEIEGAWPPEWQLVSLTATGSRDSGVLSYRVVFRRRRILRRPPRLPRTR
jgi:hypothetical protein